MSYVNKEGSLYRNDATSQMNLGAAAVQTFSYFVSRSCDAMRIACTVQTVTVGASAVTFWQRPTPGSSTGQVSLGVINIPAAAAVGKCYYKDISAVALQPGQEIALEVTSAATSGKAVPLVVVDERSEDPRNCSQMVVST